MKTQSFRLALVAMLTACAVMLAGCGEDLRPKVASLEAKAQLLEERLMSLEVDLKRAESERSRYEMSAKLIEAENAQLKEKIAKMASEIDQKTQEAKPTSFQKEQLKKFIDLGSQLIASAETNKTHRKQLDSYTGRKSPEQVALASKFLGDIAAFSKALSEFQSMWMILSEDWPKGLPSEYQLCIIESLSCWEIFEFLWTGRNGFYAGSNEQRRAIVVPFLLRRAFDGKDAYDTWNLNAFQFNAAVELANNAAASRLRDFQVKVVKQLK